MLDLSEIPLDWLIGVNWIYATPQCNAISFNQADGITDEEAIAKYGHHVKAINLHFPAGIKLIQCHVFKTENKTVPPTAFFSTRLGFPIQVTLPAVSYYPQPFELNPINAACTDIYSPSSCVANFVFPTNTDHFTLDLTNSASFTCDSQQVAVIGPTPVALIPDELGANGATININRFEFKISPNAKDLPAALTCNALIWKTSKIAPYFRVYKNEINIYQARNVLFHNVELQTLSDCFNNTSAVCTLAYTVPIEQNAETFRVSTTGFYASLDSTPVLDTQHKNLLYPEERRYTQRWLKQLTPHVPVVEQPVDMPDTPATTPASTNNNNLANNGLTTLYISGNFLSSSKLELNVANIVYDSPLVIEYDLDVCRDPAMPVCRINYKTTYTGYPLTLNLNAIPFSGVVEAVHCTHNMTIPTTYPEILITPTVTKHDPLSHTTSTQIILQNSIVEPPLGQVIQCAVDYPIPFGGYANPAGAANEKFLVNTFRQQLYSAVASTLKTNFSLPALPHADIAFSALPFTMELGAECSAQPFEPYCHYKIIVSPNNPLYDGATTLEEKQAVLRRTYLRSFSLPIYDLKRPDEGYGELIGDIVYLEVENGQLLDISFNVEFTEDTLGYDTIHVHVETFNGLLDYDTYFQDDPTPDGGKLDIVIKIHFINRLIDFESSVALKELPMYLLRYDDVPSYQPYTPIFTAPRGAIQFIPVFSLQLDAATCQHEHISYCIMRFKSLLDTEVHVTEFFKGLEVHSFLVETSALLLDVDTRRSTMEFFESITLVSPRQIEDPDTGEWVVQSNLIYNVTLKPQHRQQDRLEIWFHKFLTPRISIKLDITHYTVTRTVYDTAGNPTGQVHFITNAMTYFYILSPIIYTGDMQLSYDPDCYDKSQQTCMWRINIYSNYLYPGERLLRLETTAMHSFFYLYGTGCTGWTGVAKENSRDYIIFALAPDMSGAEVRLTTQESPVFGPTTPLQYDPLLRDSVECTFLSYKRQQSTTHPPATLPTLVMGLDFLDDPVVMMYPLINKHLYYRQYPTMIYKYFTMDMLDDCRTERIANGLLACTTRFTMNGTPLHPLTGAVGQIPREDFAGNPLITFLFTASIAGYRPYCKAPQAVPPTGTPPDFFKVQIFSSTAGLDTTSPTYDPTTSLYLQLRLPLFGTPDRRNDEGAEDHIGFYNLVVPLCHDNYTHFVNNITIFPKFQTTPNTVAYNNLQFDTGTFAQYGVVFPNTVTSQVRYPFITNKKDNASYLIESNSPDRFAISQFVLKKFLDIVLGKHIVHHAEDVEVEFILNELSLNYLLIDSVLGPFDFKPANCTSLEYDAVTKTTTERVLATLTTDSSAGATYFKIVGATNTTLNPDHNQSEGLYKTGASCRVILPVSFIYPTRWYDIHHQVFVTTEATPFFLRRNYPQYTHPSVLKVIRKDEVGAAGVSHHGFWCVVLSVVVVATLALL